MQYVLVAALAGILRVGASMTCATAPSAQQLSLVQRERQVVVKQATSTQKADDVDSYMPWWARRVPRHVPTDKKVSPLPASAMTSLVRTPLISKHKTEPPAAPRAAQDLKIFCIVLCKDHEEFVLVNYMQKQLRQCDDYVVASNRSVSSAFHFQTEILIQGTMDSTSNGLNPLNTEIFISLWKALAKRKGIEQYDWIVKIDPDTFFRPAQMRLALSRYGTEPVVVAHRPNNVTHLPGQGFLSLDHYPLVKGDSSMWYTARLFAMYAISKPIFDVFRTQGCEITAHTQPHEDVWWQACMQTRPYLEINAHLAQPEGRCVDFVWNAYVYAPKNYDGRFPITVDMVDSLRAGKTLYNEQGFCMSGDITAFHPVKSALAYRRLEKMFFEDGTNTKDYWDAQSFSPAGGWSTSAETKSHGPLKLGCCDDHIACVRQTKPMDLRRTARSSVKSLTDTATNASESSCFYHRAMETYGD